MPADNQPQPQPPVNDYVEDRVKDFLGDTTLEKQDIPDKEHKATKEEAQGKQEIQKEVAPKPPVDNKDLLSLVDKGKKDPVDIDKLKAELAKELEDKQKVQTEKILEVLTGEKAQTQKFLTEMPWAKDKRNPRDWAEVAAWAKDESVAQIKKDMAKEAEENAKALKEAEEQEKVYREETARKWDTYFDHQIRQLTTDGKIPELPAEIAQKITDGTATDEDLKHPGAVAIKELMEQALKLNEGLAPESQEWDLEKVYYKHLSNKPTSRQPAGADAPVSLGKGSPKVEGNDEKFFYDEIHAARDLWGVVKK